MNILRALMCLALALSTSPVLTAAQHHLLSDWHGVLNTPAGQLTMLVQFEEMVGAGLSGDLERIDQAPGPQSSLASIVGTTQRLGFAIPAIGATYDATWSETEQSCFGDVRLGAALHLELKRGTPAVVPVVAGMDGIWRVSLQRKGARLRLVLHVATSDGGNRG